MNYLDKMQSLPVQERLQIATMTNTWAVPDWFIKCENWDNMTDREKFEDKGFRGLRDAVKKTTSGFERSQHWWVSKLGRTKEAHLAWWDNGQSPHDE